MNRRTFMKRALLAACGCVLPAVAAKQQKHTYTIKATDAASFNAVWWDQADYAEPGDGPSCEVVTCTLRGGKWTIERGAG